MKGGDGPTMAVLLAVDAHTLIDDKLIVPFDSVATSAEDSAWLRSFYPAFLANGRIGGQTWGIPFQRSTIVLFWNKQLFEQAGLDPARPARADWAEHAAMAARISKPGERWGTLIPATGFSYWLFQALQAQGGRDAGQRRRHAGLVRQPGLVECIDLLAGAAGLGRHAARASWNGRRRRATSWRGGPA